MTKNEMEKMVAELHEKLVGIYAEIISKGNFNANGDPMDDKSRQIVKEYKSKLDPIYGEIAKIENEYTAEHDPIGKDEDIFEYLIKGCSNEK